MWSIILGALVYWQTRKTLVGRNSYPSRFSQIEESSIICCLLLFVLFVDRPLQWKVSGHCVPFFISNIIDSLIRISSLDEDSGEHCHIYEKLCKLGESYWAWQLLHGRLFPNLRNEICFSQGSSVLFCCFENHGMILAGIVHLLRWTSLISWALKCLNLSFYHNRGMTSDHRL